MKKPFLLIIIHLFAISSFAQWVPTNGPNGGDVNCFAFSGDYIFAGTNSGAFITSDNGANWTAINNGFPEFIGISSLAVSGSNLYAGTWAGLFKSTDNGSNWVGVNNGIPGLNNDIQLLAVSGNNILVWADYNLFVSVDNGDNWTAVNVGLTVFSSICSFAFSGANIFLGASEYGGVFMSSDNGFNWTPVLEGVSVSCLVAMNGSVYCGTSNGEVFFSNDNGSNWTSLNTNWPQYTEIRALAIIGDVILLGTSDQGVFQSINGGISWTSVSGGLFNNYVNCFAQNGNYWYAGTEGGGAYLTSDNGNSWHAINNGLGYSWVNSLTASDNNLFAATYGSGVLRFSEVDNTWHAVNNGLSRCRIHCMAANDVSVFAGTDRGVFVSTDNGISWNTSASSLVYSDVGSLVICGDYILARQGSHIYVSSDNAISWYTPTGDPSLFLSIVMSLLADGSNVFAFTAGGGVYKSVDNGISWAQLSSINADYPRVAAATDNCLFVSNGGLSDENFVSSSCDNGITWVSSENGLANGEQVLSFAVRGNIIFAGARGHGVYMSTNNGNNWTPIDNGLIDRDVYALAISGDYLYASVMGGGVWKRSLDEVIGVPNVEEVSIELYPNPARDYFEVNAGNSAFIKLYDQLGREVLSQRTSGKTTVQMDHFPEGIYVVKVIVDNEVVATSKIVKQ